MEGPWGLEESHVFICILYNITMAVAGKIDLIGEKVEAGSQTRSAEVWRGMMVLLTGWYLWRWGKKGRIGCFGDRVNKTC